MYSFLWQGGEIGEESDLLFATAHLTETSGSYHLDHDGFFYYPMSMFKFFLKKNFADVWDNLFHFVFINFLLIVVGVLSVLGLFGLNALPLDDMKRSMVIMAGIFVVSAIFHVFVFAEGSNVGNVSNYGASKVGSFFSNILPSMKIGIQYGLLVAGFLCVALVSIPYYCRMWIPTDGSKGSFLGLIFMSLVFWLEVISLLSLQWFIPIRNLMHNNFIKCLKKSYIIFFDNVWFSIAVAFINFLNVLITIFTLGLIPGISGLQLTVTNALRLRLYKYDWYEVNPGMTSKQRKDVPWDELIAADIQALGPRSWKSFIFPWKEQ